MSSSPVALVTGASSGIGQAVAQRLAQRGYHVFGTSRNADLSASSTTGVELLTLDVTLDDSVTTCVQTVLERAGRIDVLVNNAGYALLGAVEETTLAEAHAVFETDFFGAVRMTQAVLPTMRSQQKGRIILMSVILGLIGQPFGAFLSSAKHALEGFGESLTYEVQPLGISVSLIEPSFVATNAGRALQRTMHQIDAYAPRREKVRAKFLHDLQSGIAPEQVAQVVERIVDAPSPRLRYPVGTQARLTPTMKQLIPQGMFASVARNAYGL